MANAGSFLFRFFSSRLRAAATGLIALLFALMVWSPWRGQAQAPIKAPAFRQGGGHLTMAPLKVPFKPGPKGPDGKVHQLPPGKLHFMPEREFERAEAAKERAAAGIFDLTTKPRTRALSRAELKGLNWAPTKLNVPGLSTQQPHPASTSMPARSTHGSTSSASTQVQSGFPGIGYDGAVPPDGGVAAGHVNVVAVVNSTINVWDKNGTLLSSQLLGDFYAAVGTPAQDDLFDPSVEYDFDLQRFFVLATSLNNSANRSNFLLAVSQADDVTQGWSVFAFDATLNGNSGTGNWCDYPHLGMDSVAIYMSCNMFSFPSSTGSFQYDKIRIMTKDELVNGGCCSWWDFWDLREGFLNLFVSTSVRPAVMHFARDSDGDFWINAGGQGGSDNTLHIWHLTNAANCCNGSGGPNLDESDNGVGDFGVAPAAAQPNGVQGLDSGDTRVLFATWEFGHLSVGQTIACDQGGTTDACAAFTEIDTTGYPNLSNVNDWVMGTAAGVDVCYPYVEQNANADKTMVYTRSDASSTFPGAYSVPIPNSTVCTTCVGGETTLQAGLGNYLSLDGTRNRWGDYHGAGADPDFLGIWVEGEYATATSFEWGTAIIPTFNTYVPIDSPSPSPLGFGNQAVFSASGSQGVFFTNNGNATLRITGSVNVTGDSDFFITSDGCSFAVIQSGNSCEVLVAFSPRFVGAGNASLNVPDNTPATVTSVPLSGTGVQAGTSTSIGSSLNPSTFSQAVTFTAQVLSSTAGTPTGSVTFKDGTNVLGSKTLSGGATSLTTSGLGGGTHSITATYNGDTNFLTSTAGLSQVVKPAPTATTVASSRNPSIFGQAVTFTSKVTSGVGTPTGTVTFKDGATTIGTGALSAGTATFTTPALSGGTHSIKAVYNGTANLATSTSSSVAQTVKKATTKTALASSVNPSSFGQKITFTAKVTPQFGGTVTGNVVFKDGTTTLGAGAISGGKATLSVSLSHPGNHSMTATYAGNGSLVGSTSPALTQVVHKANTKTTLTSAPNPSKSGHAVTFTATITPNFTGAPTGTVRFRDNTTATVLGTGAVNATRHATFTTTKLAVGTHSVSAIYGGDTNFNSSTSAAHNQIVTK
jgi:hypothetical protein